MTIQRGRELFGRDDLLYQMMAGIPVGLLLGIGSLWLAPCIAWNLGSRHCDMCLTQEGGDGSVGDLMATAGIVFEEQVTQLPVAGMSLHVPDRFLVAGGGHRLVESGFGFVRTPLDWPLLVFDGVTLQATYFAMM